MSRLCTKTRELLLARPRTQTYKIISDATGLHPDWIMCFAQDRMDDPGVRKVEKLYEYLSGRTLKV